MNKHRPARLATLVVILTMFGLAAPNFAKELEIGASIPKPDREMKNVDGKQVSVADVKGKEGTVVAFWCNHCPWVVKWRPRFVELAKTYQDKGFGFIAVNANDPQKVAGDSLEAMKKYAEEYGYSFPYVVDEGSKLAAAYGAARTPHVYVFDEDDKLIYVGAIDDNARDAGKVDKAYLKDALEALLADKDVPTAQSKALGCTIKWYKN